MSGQIKRRDVDWSRGSCLGLDTQLFFSDRTALLLEGLSYHHLRRICFDCPIQKECLIIGVAHEPYGFWGGLSEEERRHVYADKQSRTVEGLKRDLRLLGIKYDYIYGIVKSVVRDFYVSEPFRKR